jgi:alkanesulfonate monooxygenase SsuD/methylene tetrahydromethanopterin reductase-like flavin-dependent oxidoreductase (luciferase family)
MGSLSLKSMERVVDYCDGWYPVESPFQALEHRLHLLREAAERAGRKFETIDLAIALFVPEKDKCKRLIDLGFRHIILAQPSLPRDEALKRLDLAASYVAAL